MASEEAMPKISDNRKWACANLMFDTIDPSSRNNFALKIPLIVRYIIKILTNNN